MPNQDKPDDPNYTLERLYQGAPDKRLRFTSKDVKRGETEPVNFRCHSPHVARLEKIVASQIDPHLETKSDILQDAVHMWLQKWDEDFGDGADGELFYQFRLREIQRRSEYQHAFIDTSENIFETLKNDHDVNGMKEYLVSMVEARFNFVGSGVPPKILERMDILIESTRRLVKDAE